MGGWLRTGLQRLRRLCAQHLHQHLRESMVLCTCYRQPAPSQSLVWPQECSPITGLVKVALHAECSCDAARGFKPVPPRSGKCVRLPVLRGDGCPGQTPE
jgi:hypothetical protein